MYFILIPLKQLLIFFNFNANGHVPIKISSFLKYLLLI